MLINESDFVWNANGNPNVADATFDIVPGLTQNFFEVIGPTGSTHVWAPLNDLPTDIDWIEIKVVVYASGGGASQNTHISANARGMAGTEAAGNDNTVGGAYYYTDSGSNGQGSSTMVLRVPVTNREFKMRWSGSATLPTTKQVILVLTDFGYNSRPKVTP